MKKLLAPIMLQAIFITIMGAVDPYPDPTK